MSCIFLISLLKQCGWAVVRQLSWALDHSRKPYLATFHLKPVPGKTSMNINRVKNSWYSPSWKANTVMVSPICALPLLLPGNCSLTDPSSNLSFSHQSKSLFPSPHPNHFAWWRTVLEYLWTRLVLSSSSGQALPFLLHIFQLQDPCWIFFACSRSSHHC